MKSALTSELDIKWKVGDPAPPSLTPFTEAELLKMWGGKTEPVVSILCPTYNHRDFIKQTLDGFLGQKTSFPFEVIVRDDASTDGTKEILYGYSICYPSVIRPIFELSNTFSRGKNFLPPLARSARSRLIALCGGDDYWIDPDKLELQYQLLYRDPTVLLVSTASVTVRDGSIQSVDDFNMASTQSSCRNRMRFVSTWLLNRDRIDLTSDLFDEILCEDLFVKSQIDASGDSLHLDNRVTTARHCHPDSIWGGAGSRVNNYKKLQIINSWLWIVEHHRRTKQHRMAYRQMRSAVGTWIDYLESVGSGCSLMFLLVMVGIMAKRFVLGKKRT